MEQLGPHARTQLTAELQQHHYLCSQVIPVGAAKMFGVAGTNHSCYGVTAGSRPGQVPSPLQGHSDGQTTVHVHTHDYQFRVAFTRRQHFNSRIPTEVEYVVHMSLLIIEGG